MTTAIIIYLILINVFAFALCVFDKRAAIAQRRRISERALFGVSIIGGAASMLFAMLLVRHKTRQPRFMVFLPLFIAAHIFIVVYFLL